MLTSYVDVILSNSPRVSLDQGHLPSDHALLLEVLLEICICGDLEDILQLLEDGETVTIGSRYDVLLEGEADNTLRVMTSPDSQDLLLNYQHVLEIVEGYRELQRVSRDVKFDLGLLQRDSYICLTDKKSVGRSTKITEGINDSPFTGHAYNNMEVEEGVLHDGGFAKVLESLEQYNRLATRRHPDNFTTISLPPNPLPEPLHPLPMDTSLDPTTQDDLFNTPASFLNTPPVDGRGRPWLSLTPEQIRQPHFSSSSPQPELVDDFLESSLPKDSPYPERLEGINFVGKLGELLQGHGTGHSIDYQFTNHSQTSFSAVLKFEFGGLKHEYESDARYRNKKDAKKNVAYTAYTAICPECIPVDDDEDNNSSVAVSQPEPPTTTIATEEPAPRHKSLLQEFCQKRQISGFGMPRFKSVDRGDLMVHGFVSTVTIETPYGTIEETSSPNPQKKPSEFHAAFLAYQTLLKLESGSQQPPTADRAASSTSPPASSSTTRTNWKNKLQELFQGNRLRIPVYEPYKSVDGLHKSTVKFRIEEDGEEFSLSSEFHTGIKTAEQQAAEMAYTALARNNPSIFLKGKQRDFEDWHRSRDYPLPAFETKPVKTYPFMTFQCTVKFSDKRSQDCTGNEERSKNDAKFSAIAGAIEKLEALHLWDINYEA